MKAISSMATRHVLGELLSQAEQAGLPAVELESVGGVDAARRVADGEPFDLVLLADDALRGLADAGAVDAASVVPLLLSQVAVGVPSGDDAEAAPVRGAAFADADALRDALCTATRIGFSTGPSGTALVTMIDGWGLGELLSDRLVQARPGVPVARLIADGEVDLGLQQLSELVGQPRVRILGVLPPDCAIDTVFSGAVASTAADRDQVHAVLAFLSSDAALPAIATHNFAAAPAAER